MKNNKKARYKRDDKKIDREVISYEQVPLDDYEEEDPKITKYAIKRVLKVTLILFACAVVVIAFANREKLTVDNISNWIEFELLGSGDGEGYPASIIGTNIKDGNIYSVGSSVAYVSDTSFVALSPNAYEISNRQHSFSQPIITQNNGKMLVYNLGGKSFEINTLKEKTYSGETEDKIFTADINSNGYYALVTQANGYLSKVYVYDNNNKKIFTYSFSEHYITCVALNSDGTKIAACGVSTSKGSAVGAVYLLDFKEETPIYVKKFEDNIIYDVKFLTSNSFSVISNKGSYVLNSNDEKQFSNDYNEMPLTAYSINTDTGCYATSVSRSGDGRLCDIQYIDSNGELIKKISTDLKITSISTYKDKIAVLSQNNIYIYNTQGTLLNSVNAGTDARQVKIYSDNSAYILGISEIRQINFEQQKQLVSSQGAENGT